MLGKTHLPHAPDVSQGCAQQWSFQRAVPQLRAEVGLESSGVVVQIFHDVAQAFSLWVEWGWGWGVWGLLVVSRTVGKMHL